MRVRNGNLSYAASAALAPYRRAKLTNGKLAYAGALDRELGVLEDRVLAADALGSVVPPNAEGTVKMVAAGAIDQYAEVFGAADGKVSATPNSNPIGIALIAATGDGSYIEVLRLKLARSMSVVETYTADHAVTVADSGKTFTTDGAAGAVKFALPVAIQGLKYRFRVGAAQELRIDPNGNETIALPSSGVQGAAGKYLTANADGETVEIECTKDGQWSVFGYTSTWEAEA